MGGLTVLIGPNHAGKTSFLLPLLALKQTLDSPDPRVALKLTGDYADLGSYRDLVYMGTKNLEVAFGLRFAYHGQASDDVKKVGDEHPGILTVSYKQGAQGQASIDTYALDDCYGRTFIRRSRLKDGQHFGLAGAPVSGAHRPSEAHNPGDRAARKAVESEQPVHFLFTGESAGRAGLGVDRQLHENHGDEDSSLPEHGPSDPVRYYMRATAFTSTQIHGLLQHLQFIGPIRSKPQRIYQLSDELPLDVGVQGELAPELLYRASEEIQQEIQRTLKRFGLSVAPDFQVYDRDDRAFSLLLRDHHGHSVNFADAGFGYSQLLPLLIQLAAVQPDEHLLIEQPEIHLNPALQGTFADIAMEQVAEGANVTVETHSDHVLLRIRRRIAEGTFDPALLNLYYFEPEAGESIIRKVDVDARGRISEDQWPAGFFADDVEDSVALARASLRDQDD